MKAELRWNVTCLGLVLSYLELKSLIVCVSNPRKDGKDLKSSPVQIGGFEMTSQTNEVLIISSFWINFDGLTCLIKHPQYHHELLMSLTFLDTTPPRMMLDQPNLTLFEVSILAPPPPPPLPPHKNFMSSLLEVSIHPRLEEMNFFAKFLSTILLYKIFQYMFVLFLFKAKLFPAAIVHFGSSETQGKCIQKTFVVM